MALLAACQSTHSHAAPCRDEGMQGARSRASRSSPSLTHPPRAQPAALWLRVCALGEEPPFRRRCEQARLQTPGRSGAALPSPAGALGHGSDQRSAAPAPCVPGPGLGTGDSSGTARGQPGEARGGQPGAAPRGRAGRGRAGAWGGWGRPRCRDPQQVPGGATGGRRREAGPGGSQLLEVRAGKRGGFPGGQHTAGSTPCPAFPFLHPLNLQLGFRSPAESPELGGVRAAGSSPAGPAPSRRAAELVLPGQPGPEALGGELGAAGGPARPCPADGLQTAPGRCAALCCPHGACSASGSPGEVPLLRLFSPHFHAPAALLGEVANSFSRCCSACAWGVGHSP